MIIYDREKYINLSNKQKTILNRWEDAHYHYLCHQCGHSETTQNSIFDIPHKRCCKCGGLASIPAAGERFIINGDEITNFLENYLQQEGFYQA